MGEISVRPNSKKRREAQEKEANNLIPEGVQRFDDRGDDVLEKRPAVADGLALPHDFIVTEWTWSGHFWPVTAPAYDEHSVNCR